MERIWLVPVLVSILILGTLGLSQPAVGIVYDPQIQILNPNPNTAGVGDAFGWAVHMVGNNVLVGAPNHNTAGTDNAGIVYASDSGKAVSYAQIAVGNNQTLMALYTIPAGKTGYLIQGTNSLIGTNRNYAVSGKQLMRPYGGVFQLKKTFGLETDGTSFMVLPHPLPSRIPEKTDIRVSAISSTAGSGINTTFEILLVDN